MRPVVQKPYRCSSDPRSRRPKARRQRCNTDLLCSSNACASSPRIDLASLLRERPFTSTSRSKRCSQCLYQDVRYEDRPGTEFPGVHPRYFERLHTLKIRSWPGAGPEHVSSWWRDRPDSPAARAFSIRDFALMMAARALFALTPRACASTFSLCLASRLSWGGETLGGTIFV